MVKEYAVKKGIPPFWLRWSVWLAVSLSMFGGYYVYDSISPLADLLQSQLGFSDSQIGMLQAVYNLPNIIMVLLGGVIIDRIGTRKASFLFAFLVMLGAGLTAVSPNIWLMASGRLIFGMGAESLIVAITTILARWFKQKELSLAFALNLTIARLGTLLALNSPSWAAEAYQHWQGPLMISAAAGALSIVLISFFYFLDRTYASRYAMDPEGAQDKIEWREVFRFDRKFWYLTCVCSFFYAAIFPFQTFAVKFFQEVHGVSREAGGFLSGILAIMAMVLTPVFGMIADRLRRREYLLLIGSFFLLPVYFMMSTGWISGDASVLLNIPLFRLHVELPVHLLIPMLSMGVGFSMLPSVLWPMVSLMIDSKKLGTAYGLMTMIQNIVIGITNVSVGFANDIFGASGSNPEGYIPGMNIFTLWIVFTLFASWALIRIKK